MSCANNDDGKFPNDPYFLKQWHLQNNKGRGTGGINLPKAWELSTGSSEITLAIIDRGFSLNASDLGGSEQCRNRYSFHDMSDGRVAIDKHGQLVLGSALACTENNVGLAGVDWFAKGLGITAKTQDEREILKSVQWAAGLDDSTVVNAPKRADVINVSYGGIRFDTRVEEELTIIKQMNEKGIVFVTSSGNSAKNAQGDWLNNLPGVIVIGASNAQGQATGFSNWGKTVSVYSPGTGLYADVDNYRHEIHGTSYAAPIASAVITLIKSIYPVNEEFNWKFAKYFLEASAMPMTCEDYCPNSLQRADKKDDKGKIVGERNAQPDCQNDCCAQGILSNTCSAGLIDAHKAMLLAQQGIPNAALIDTDTYFVKFRRQESDTQQLLISNLGKARAKVKLVADDQNVVITNQEVVIEERNDRVASSLISIKYNNLARLRARKVSRLHIEATSFDKVNGYKDVLNLFIVADMK